MYEYMYILIFVSFIDQLVFFVLHLVFIYMYNTVGNDVTHIGHVFGLVFLSHHHHTVIAITTTTTAAAATRSRSSR